MWRERERLEPLERARTPRGTLRALRSVSNQWLSTLNVLETFILSANVSVLNLFYFRASLFEVSSLPAALCVLLLRNALLVLK